jgi:hypothetical protein
MMGLYGYWQQLDGTVRCYTAGGRIMLSSVPSQRRNNQREHFRVQV